MRYLAVKFGEDRAEIFPFDEHRSLIVDAETLQVKYVHTPGIFANRLRVVVRGIVSRAVLAIPYARMLQDEDTYYVYANLFLVTDTLQRQRKFVFFTQLPSEVMEDCVTSDRLMSYVPHFGGTPRKYVEVV